MKNHACFSNGFQVKIRLVFALVFFLGGWFLLLPLYARADTETLRPNTAGDLSQFTKSGTGGENWDRIDEETADGDTSYVAGGTSEVCGGVNFSIAIKENSITTLVAKTITTSYADYSNQWNTRPSDGGSWTIADLNALQAGIKVVGDYNTSSDLYNLPDSSISVGSIINFVKVFTNVKCQTGAFANLRATQVYVVVGYTLPTPSGGGGPSLPAPIVSLSADPTSIVKGQSSTLAWSATNVSSCWSPDWSDATSSGSMTVTPT